MTLPGSTHFKGPETESPLTFGQRLASPPGEMLCAFWESETGSLAWSTSTSQRGDRESGRGCHLPKVTMKQVPRCCGRASGGASTPDLLRTPSSVTSTNSVPGSRCRPPPRPERGSPRCGLQASPGPARQGGDPSSRRCPTALAPQSPHLPAEPGAGAMEGGGPRLAGEDGGHMGSGGGGPHLRAWETRAEGPREGIGGPGVPASQPGIEGEQQWSGAPPSAGGTCARAGSG